MKTQEMIRKKNRMLKDAGNALMEIWRISLMLDNVQCVGDSNYKTLVNTVNERLGILTYGYRELLKEAEVDLPGVEEEDGFLSLPEGDEKEVTKDD